MVAAENPQKRVLIDTHVHLYPFYSLEAWFSAAIKNLTPNEAGSLVDRRVVCIVDRQGQDSKSAIITASRNGPLKFELGSSEIHGVLSDGTSNLDVIFGTQSVAKEGIEVLGLGVRDRLPEGAFAEEIINSVLNQGGVPCLPWSPGKWLGRRGRVVHAMFDTFGPHVLTVGDISIRSTLGPPALLLHHARSSGFAVLNGTDPLPLVGDELLVGSHGLDLSGDFASDQMLPWLFTELRTAMKLQQQHGRRNSPGQAIFRFAGNMLKSRKND